MNLAKITHDLLLGKWYLKFSTALYSTLKWLCCSWNRPLMSFCCLWWSSSLTFYILRILHKTLQTMLATIRNEQRVYPQVPVDSTKIIQFTLAANQAKDLSLTIWYFNFLYLFFTHCWISLFKHCLIYRHLKLNGW